MPAAFHRAALFPVFSLAILMLGQRSPAARAPPQDGTCEIYTFKPPFNPDEQVSPELIRHGIEADFEPWRNERFDVRMLEHMLLQLKETDVVKLVAIVDNEVYFPRGPNDAHKTDCDNDDDGKCNSMFGGMLQLFRAAFRAGWRVPDVAWIMNTQDDPKCYGRQPGVANTVHTWTTNCSLPVFSSIKKSCNDDIMIPYSLDADITHIEYPWACKRDTALWRGTAFCMYAHTLARCSRSHLARLGARRSDVLDVGLTSEYGQWFERESDPEPFRDGPLAVAERIAMEDHAKWRYLLSLDGIAASTRFGKVLCTNSLVLKQRSDWLEWYYRTVHPGVHYEEFWTASADDVLQVVEALRRNDTHAQRVAAAAQAFCDRNLILSAKMAYWKEALRRYSSLFSDMPTVIDVLKKGPLLAVLRRKHMQEAEAAVT